MTTTICVVAFSRIAKDGRVRRQIESLSEIARVITVGYGERPPKSSEHYEIPGGLKYLPLKLSGLVALLLRRFQHAYDHTQAVKWTRECLAGLQVDGFVLNDVQTIGILDTHHPQAPFVVDMHEFAPEEMSDDWRFRLLLRRYYTHLCHQHLKKAAAVITVSDTIAHEFTARFGIECSTIRNSREYVDLPLQFESSTKLRLVHAGLASKGRHLEVMIDAVTELPGVTLDLFLVEAPRQKRYFKKVTSYAANAPNVRVRTPVAPEQLVAVLSEYQVGLLIIAPSNFSLAHCLPNKLFEYVQARLMVISGPTPDVQKIVESYGLGRVISDFSSEKLRSCLSELSQADVVNYRRNANAAALELSFSADSHLLQAAVTRALMSS